MIPEPLQPTRDEALRAWQTRHAINYSAEFVPFSKSRNARPKAKTSELSINWRVTLTCNGLAFLCDYSQGIGHLPKALQVPWGGHVSIDLDAAIRASVEHIGYRSGPSLTPPTVSDVLSSLALDASVLNAGDFENWARDFGYDSDSRSAEALYRTCRNQALRLRAIIGGPALDELLAIPED